MVIYNPKDWWKLILSFQRSDTFRIMLPGIVGMAVFTGLVVYVELDFLHITYKNTTTIHAMVGFVLSMLLVFRTNSAYDRWWEGRKAWGSLVNNSRNLAIKLSALPIHNDVKLRFKVLITNYVFASKEHLRSGVDGSELDPCDKYSKEDYLLFNHVPNRIAQLILIEVQSLVEAKILSHEQLLFINPELSSFTDNIGICERIKKTPIPYSYNIFLKKIIFIYIITMPFGFAMEFGYWSIFIVSILFYIFGSIEIIAEEIEDPFGLDDNDLPTDQISSTIEQNLDEILK
ncbi:MAG: bestrophin family ion channel [Bacteroidia bacterium]